jgi:ABC-2 type transport system ATP-binding protein
MIEASKVTKKYGDFTALNELSCSIPGGCIYGLVGSNGAGKSTLLRLINGIYRTDGGSLTFDGKPVYNNPEVKERFVFVPDELWFLPQSNMKRMALFHAANYRNFDFKRFDDLVATFRLSADANLNTFSKGMRRQAALILALSTKSEYLFMDETFDGLDPVMRNLVKRVLYADIEDRHATAVITSHSLRELEDTCDQLALLHKGGILFESDVQNLKTSMYKVQVAFADAFDRTKFEALPVVACHQSGSVATVILRGDRAENERALRAMSPLLLEFLPLTLEEVFIYETQALGYTFNASIA